MDIRFILVVVMLVLAIINDYRSRKIKNVIPFSAILVGIVLNLFYKDINMLFSLFISIAYFFFLYFIPRTFRINEFMGAGDIKLYMAVSFLMGWKFSLYSFLYSIAVGAVILFLLNLRRVREIVLNTVMFFFFRGKWEIDESEEKTNMFTPYILAGCVLQYILQYDWLPLWLNF